MTNHDPSVTNVGRVTHSDVMAVSINEAARLSGLGRTKLYELMKAGKLPSVKIAGRRLIMIADLKVLLLDHRR